MARTIAAMEEAEVYAVGSRTLEKAQSFQREHHITKAYGSYEELASDPDVQLIYIATPHSEHYANALMCIRHGKPVLCEKAFTATAWQAEEVIAEAHKHHVFITEAIWTRYMPLTQKLREKIASGIIGNARVVTANLCYPIAQIPRIERLDLAGGALLDIGIYPINFAASVFGTDIRRIESSSMLSSTGVDVHDSITFYYDDQRMAVLNASTLVRSERLAVISGDKGYIVVEHGSNPQRMHIYNNQEELIETVDCSHKITGYEYELRACIRAIEAGEIECEEMPHAETLRIMHIMDELRHRWGVVYPWDK